MIQMQTTLAAADTAGIVGLGQLAGGFLHAERELLLLQVHQVGLELGGVLRTQLLEFHQRTVRVTKVVVTDSLAAARRNASRATSSLTPSIS